MPPASRQLNLAVAAICVGLYLLAAMFYHMGGALIGQLDNAEKIHQGAPTAFLVVHPGMYWLISALASLTHARITTAASIVGSLHFAATFAALVWLLRRLTGPLQTLPLLTCALALLFMGSICIPFLPTRYFDAHGFNRTAALLRNFTHIGVVPYMYAFLACLSLMLPRLLSGASISGKTYALAALLLAVSAIVKPSFAIAYLPALLAYLCLARKKLPPLSLLLALSPTVAIIIGEYIAGETGSVSGGPAMTYVVDPFAVWLQNNENIPIAFIAANALALYMLAVRPKQLSPLTCIAWLNLAIALVPYIALRETNEGADRNFEWSYLDAKMILMVCSAADWLLWCKTPGGGIHLPALTPKQKTGAFLLAWHGISGIIVFFAVHWHRAGH